MNLSTNARDAMPNGGLLSIGTDTVDLDKEYIKMHGLEKPGKYALISLSDTGSGMDEETRQKIFEPFFTTKELGRGTGLGLSIVYGIIKQHNGNVTVYSLPSGGTTFRIYLPLAKSSLEKTETAEVATPRGHGETILVAEDNPDVGKLIRQVLEVFGYKVIEAIDGEDAINKFLTHRDEVKLVMLDVIMPKKTGKDVGDEIKKIQPDMKILFTSGYTADVINKKGILEEGIDFISKPVTPNDLLTKVRAMLEEQAE
jgi:CheY-like chemotaxis protein